MSDATLADRRAALEAEAAALRQQLVDLGVGEAGGLDFDQNFADSSQVTAERGEVEALAAKLRETLADVERALQKIDEGTYGTCERCGQAIAEARLEAMPAARYCINCASKK
jgi:RNA polymerase-binding transcription factor DksA